MQGSSSYFRFLYLLLVIHLEALRLSKSGGLQIIPQRRIVFVHDKSKVKSYAKDVWLHEFWGISSLEAGRAAQKKVLRNVFWVMTSL